MEQCPRGFRCDPGRGLCVAATTVDSGSLDAVEAGSRDRGVADLGPGDAPAPGDAAGAIDTAPLLDASRPDTLAATDVAPGLDATPGDHASVPDVSPADSAAAPEASLDVAPLDVAGPVDSAAIPDSAGLPDTAQPDVTDASPGVDQTVNPCDTLACSTYSTCQVGAQGVASCVCDVATCTGGSCQPPGGCCSDQDCGNGGWLCDANKQCRCGWPLCHDGSCPITVDKGTLGHASSGVAWGTHFDELWDLTSGDLWLRFVYDGTGMSDAADWQSVHGYSELGVHTRDATDYSPSNQGVWFVSDYDGHAGTLGPDGDNGPSFDLDDKLLLQRATGQAEGAYDLPSLHAAPGNNHFFWFDRDGVDFWQAQAPLAADGVTYNTLGRYRIDLHLSAASPTAGRAFLQINGRSQGFEIDGDWNTVEDTPAGLSFTADLTQLQVFWGIYGYGATHSVTFEDLQITGCP